MPVVLRRSITGTEATGGGSPALSEVSLCGLSFARVRAEGLLDRMFDALRDAHGGWVVTANVDFLRRAATNPSMLALYDEADICVADGVPIVWATRLAGTPVPEQIAGSSLTWRIAERASLEGRSMFLLGGQGDAGTEAARRLQSRWPGLRLSTLCPWVGCPPTDEEMAPVIDAVVSSSPDIVLVALGSPKQEYVIRHLRPHLPASWMLGVGASLSFIAGHIPRAPEWMQRAGLEWVHRLAQEPRRLAPRYLLHDAPFALKMFGQAAWMRVRARHGT